MKQVFHLLEQNLALTITPQTHPQFLRVLERSLLSALKEGGFLETYQYCCALQTLERQYKLKKEQQVD